MMNIFKKKKFILDENEEENDYNNEDVIGDNNKKEETEEKGKKSEDESIKESKQDIYNSLIQNKDKLIDKGDKPGLEFSSSKPLSGNPVEGKIESNNENRVVSNDQNGKESENNNGDNGSKIKVIKKLRKLKKSFNPQNSDESDTQKETEKPIKAFKFNKKNFILKNTDSKKQTHDNENHTIDENHKLDEVDTQKEKKKMKKDKKNNKIKKGKEERKGKGENPEKEIEEEMKNEMERESEENDLWENNTQSEKGKTNSNTANENDDDYEEKKDITKKKKKKKNEDNVPIDNAINETTRKNNKIKNSKLMEDVKTNEDKIRLKSIYISFLKKEYNIEEYIFESLKVIIPLNKKDTFLTENNIILDNMDKNDVKKMELLWFDKLTKNKRSIINCFITLSKLGSSYKNIDGEAGINVKTDRLKKDEEKEEKKEADNPNENEPSQDSEEQISSDLSSIFCKKKDLIIIDNLVNLCNQQIKAVKEYVYYLKKNIYDISTVEDNNEKIKEMNILEPIKRREVFFYLNLCISMRYVQEDMPCVYIIPKSINPDIRGFTLHPMFYHINKKLNEQDPKKKVDMLVDNPWGKLKLLKIGKRNVKPNNRSGGGNNNINSYSSVNGNETEQKSLKKNESNDEDKFIDNLEISVAEKRELEEAERKKKAIEEMKKKKREKDHKKTFNVYSLLESAAQYFGEGPKYSNPNIHKFHKSNNNDLVYIKPPTNIDEKNILINYFLQFPSINKKLQYSKRRVYAENYGLLKIIKNNDNHPINFELNVQPWLLDQYKDMWNIQNELNKFQIWNMSNLVTEQRKFEDTTFYFTKEEFINQPDSSKSVCLVGKAETDFEKRVAKINGIKGAEEKVSKINGIKAAEEKIAKTNDVKGDEKREIITSNATRESSVGGFDLKHGTSKDYEEMKKNEQQLTKKIKKISSNEDIKQMKLTNFLSKNKINTQNVKVENKAEEKIIEENNKQDKAEINSESDDIKYLQINTKKKKKILDDEQIVEQTNENPNEHRSEAKKDNINEKNHTNENSDKNKYNQKNETENNQSYYINKNKDSFKTKTNYQKDDEKDLDAEIPKTKKKKKLNEFDETQDEANNIEDIVERQRYLDEKKKMKLDRMKNMFEMEAEESEDENIEDPEERRRAQALKKEQYDEDEFEDDDQYNNEGLNEFINNEECNSDNNVIKLKYHEEMEKLEEDIFLKKFTYQGKEFNKELTNREKLELEREKQLLKKKKLLINCSLGDVKFSDFESDSSASSSKSFKKKIKNSLYEPFRDNDDILKANNNYMQNSYNRSEFPKEYDIADEAKRKQILEKIDNVIYRKELNTDEGEKIIIKKKRKIRFHQELSDITVTEEEENEEYKKAKKKSKKINANLVENPTITHISNKNINNNNKASIKWNTNVKDVSELNTPTNGEVFNGFRKVQNIQ
ncbi:conserved Plasmodium protein, unknown function [Plasmodium berghei ANKA]|uniref:Uncharacterized protein n=1 Tax=Plasmodium berghei (strain Anka) TaxID=5823 RepID=A0A509AQV3_PLABA|nr:conserved Plasmodium protein, unknown function [Plasmodium berghei ANKA]VUC57970.1 conserved Plasmodium protein, unknown function [Plasmodium berghei ANKA]|eukprot:XP_034423739.1 conserved Plasmodium protein, unknown function [Plasmodium berghei ANKA]